jgi:hypothetical protein
VIALEVELARIGAEYAPLEPDDIADRHLAHKQDLLQSAALLLLKLMPQQHLPRLRPVREPAAKCDTDCENSRANGNAKRKTGTCIDRGSQRHLVAPWVKPVRRGTAADVSMFNI